MTLIHGRQDKPLTGAALACLAMSLFSIQDAIIKLLSSDYALLQILFVRSVIVVVPLFIILYRKNGYHAFHSNRPKDHIIRVSFNFIAFLTYYFAVTRLPLANVTAISLSAPLILVALSGPILGEPADLKRKLVLILGFVGVLIVIRPTYGDVDWLGVTAAITGASMFAMLGIQTRKMSATEDTDLMVFYGALVFLIVTGMTMPFVWHLETQQDFWIMCCVGVITLFAQYSIVHAYQFAAVYVLAPFEYVVILWAILLGWLFFNEIPTSNMLIGSFVIVCCGLAVAFMEKAEHRRR